MFKKVFSLYSAFCTQPAFYTLSLQSAFYTQSALYPWSAVCSLQSAVRSLRFTLTGIHVTERGLDLVTVLDAILTNRQTCEKLQCLS